MSTNEFQIETENIKSRYVNVGDVALCLDDRSADVDDTGAVLWVNDSNDMLTSVVLDNEAVLRAVRALIDDRLGDTVPASAIEIVEVVEASPYDSLTPEQKAQLLDTLSLASSLKKAGSLADIAAAIDKMPAASNIDEIAKVLASGTPIKSDSPNNTITTSTPSPLPPLTAREIEILKALREFFRAYDGTIPHCLKMSGLIFQNYKEVQDVAYQAIDNMLGGVVGSPLTPRQKSIIRGLLTYVARTAIGDHTSHGWIPGVGLPVENSEAQAILDILKPWLT